MTNSRVVICFFCLSLCFQLSMGAAAQEAPAASLPTSAPATENVNPAALMALPGDYAGRTVRFTVMASGGLTRGSDGTSSVYIDDYFHLSPVLQGDVLRKWLKAGFFPDRVYRITFIGHVIPDPNTPFVNFYVEDFSIN